jgi:hypothetical protein
METINKIDSENIEIVTEVKTIINKKMLERNKEIIEKQLSDLNLRLKQFE